MTFIEVSWEIEYTIRGPESPTLEPNIDKESQLNEYAAQAIETKI